MSRIFPEIWRKAKAAHLIRNILPSRLWSGKDGKEAFQSHFLRFSPGFGTKETKISHEVSIDLKARFWS